MTKPINIDKITSIPEPIAPSILDQVSEEKNSIPVATGVSGDTIFSNQNNIESVPPINNTQVGAGAVAQIPEYKQPQLQPQQESTPSFPTDFNPLDVSQNISTLYNDVSNGLSNVKENFIKPLFDISDKEGQQFEAEDGQKLNDVINNVPSQTGESFYQTKENELDSITSEELNKKASSLLNVKPEKIDEVVDKGYISYLFSPIPDNLDEKSEEEKQKEEKKYANLITEELSKYLTGESSLGVYTKERGLKTEPFVEMVGEFLSNDVFITQEYQKEIQNLPKEQVSKKTKEYHLSLLNNFKKTLKKSTENHGLFWLLPGLGEEVKENISMADYRDFKNNIAQKYQDYIMVREDEYKKQQAKSFIEKARENKGIEGSKLEDVVKARNKWFETFSINTTNVIKNNRTFSEGTIEDRVKMIKKGDIYVGMYKKTMRPIIDAYNKTYKNYLKNKDKISNDKKVEIENKLIKEFNRINSVSDKINKAYIVGLKADLEGGDASYAINNTLKGEEGIDTNLYGEKTIFEETIENAIVGNLGSISSEINSESNDSKTFSLYNALNIIGNVGSRMFAYAGHKINKTIDQVLQYGFDKAGFGYVGGGTNLSIAGFSEGVVDTSINEDNSWWYNTYVKSIYRTSDYGQELLGFLGSLETVQGVSNIGAIIGKQESVVNVYNKIKKAAEFENFVTSYYKGNNTARLLFKSLGIAAKGAVEATKQITIGEMFGGAIDQKMGTVSNDLDIYFNMAFGLIDLWQGFAPALREFKLFKNIGVEEGNRILSSLGENYKATDSFIKSVNELLQQAEKDVDTLWKANPQEANRTAKWSFFKKMLFNGNIPLKERANVTDAIISIMKGDFKDIPESVQKYVKGMLENVATDQVTIAKFVEDVLMPKYVDGEGKTIVGSEPNIEFGPSIKIGENLVSNEEITAIKAPKDVEKVGIKGDKITYTEQEVLKIKDKANKLEDSGGIETEGLKKENIDANFIKQDDGTYKANIEGLGIKDNRTQSQKVFDEAVKNRSGKDFYKIMVDKGYKQEAQEFINANVYDVILKTISDTIC